MELSTKNKQILLVAMVWGASLFLGLVFFLGPDLQKLSLAKAAKREDAEKQGVLRNIAQLEAERQAYRQQLAETGDVTWLVETLNQISKKTNVKIISITPLQTQQIRQYEKVSLRLDAKCRYHELGKFVSQIESYDKLIKVSGVTARRPDDAASKLLEVSLVVSAFHAR